MKKAFEVKTFCTHYVCTAVLQCSTRIVLNHSMSTARTSIIHKECGLKLEWNVHSTSVDSLGPSKHTVKSRNQQSTPSYYSSVMHPDVPM